MRKDQIKKKAKEFFNRKPGTPVCFITSDGNVFPGNYERFARAHARENGHEVHRFTSDQVDIEDLKGRKGDAEEESKQEGQKGEEEPREISTDRIEEVVDIAMDEGVVERKNNTLYYGETKIGGTPHKRAEVFNNDPKLFDHLEAELDLDNRGLGEDQNEAG